MMSLDALLALRGEAFVRAAYHLFLGREPDETGLRHYVRRLARGCGKASVIRDLAQSKEVRSRSHPRDLASLPDEAFIDAVFHRYLGRAPDPGGKAHFIAALEQHRDRQRVIREVESSAEGRKRSEFEQDLEALIREDKAARGWRKWWRRGERIEREIAVLEARFERSIDELVQRIDGASSYQPTARPGHPLGHGVSPEAMSPDLSSEARRHFRRLRSASTALGPWSR